MKGLVSMLGLLGAAMGRVDDGVVTFHPVRSPRLIGSSAPR